MAQARAIATEIGLALENRLLRDHDVVMRGLLDAVVRESSNGVVVVDAAGLLAVANRAAVSLTGVALASRIGRPFEDVVADALKWHFVNPEDFARALRDALPLNEEVRWEERTVGGRAVQMVCAPLHGPGGEDLGHVITLGEITDARRELQEIERQAREREQQMAIREQRVREESAMTRAAHQLSLSLTPDDVHRRLMNEASQAVGANRVAILALRGTQATVITSRGFTRATLAALVRSPLRRTALRRTFATHRVFVCNETDNEPDDPGIRAMRAEGMRSLMHVPITLGGRIYGALTVSSTEPRTYTERDVKVLSELAGHAAGALRNAEQFARNRNLADLLQESLLAKELPSVPGLSLAALYRAAAGEMVGGDFYDVWTMTDGRVAVVVGDVSGKGPEAAATTAMVRHMIDGLSAADTAPSDLIEHLNSLLVTRLAPEALVTVVLALYDSEAGTLTWCNAGHPPPLLLCKDHGLRRLGLPEPPCGAFADSRYTEHTTRFEVGDTLLLYTDGLIEARNRGEEFGEARLAAEASELAEESPSGLARGLYAAVRQWAEDGRINDDVAIAVVRRST
jgi:serine phosphatase RsbU (regulator of sigma subunit)